VDYYTTDMAVKSTEVHKQLHNQLPERFRVDTRKPTPRLTTSSCWILHFHKKNENTLFNIFSETKFFHSNKPNRAHNSQVHKDEGAASSTLIKDTNLPIVLMGSRSKMCLTELAASPPIFIMFGSNDPEGVS